MMSDLSEQDKASYYRDFKSSSFLVGTVNSYQSQPSSLKFLAPSQFISLWVFPNLLTASPTLCVPLFFFFFLSLSPLPMCDSLFLCPPQPCVCLSYSQFLTCSYSFSSFLSSSVSPCLSVSLSLCMYVCVSLSVILHLLSIFIHILSL